MKNLKKKTALVSLIIVIVGIFVAEFFMIKNANETYQNNTAANLYEDIKNDLYLLKTSIVEQDHDYFNNATKFYSDVEKLNKLSIVVSRDSERIDLLNEYSHLVLDKASSGEIIVFSEYRDYIGQLIGKINEIGGDLNKDAISSLIKQIDEFKNNLPEVAAEFLPNINNKIISMFDKIKASATEISNCINVCYSDKFNSLANDLKNSITNTKNELAGINKQMMTEVFEIEKLDEILNILK